MYCEFCRLKEDVYIDTIKSRPNKYNNWLSGSIATWYLILEYTNQIPLYNLFLGSNLLVCLTNSGWQLFISRFDFLDKTVTN